MRELELRLARIERRAAANWRLALTDRLTGLPNRRHLELHLDRTLARAATRPRSLVLFDVDDFKRFNDLHGYPAGDRALATVGTVLARVSATDPGGSRFAARLGGDEFVATLPGNSPGEARDRARLLANAVARHPRLSRHGVTVSFGVATLHAGLRHWQDLLAAADADLRRRRSAQRALPGSRRAAAFGLHGRDEP